MGRSDLLLENPSFTAAGCCACSSGAFCQGDFGLPGQGAEGHMGYIGRHAEDHWPFGIFTQYSSRIDRLIVKKRQRIQLSPQDQYIIPGRHRHFGAHRAADALSRHCHLMDFFHIAV